MAAVAADTVEEIDAAAVAADTAATETEIAEALVEAAAVTGQDTKH
jgi:hypothetical protein